MGRFINADSFVATGQGITGNNMFAYCNNNPVNASDSHGHFTISIGFCFDGYAFLGASVGISIAFDSAGNIEIQESYSVPTEREKQHQSAYCTWVLLALCKSQISLMFLS